MASGSKTKSMVSLEDMVQNGESLEGAEIVYGSEECQKQSLELLEELGFPKGVMPLKDLVECGRIRDKGFVWMRQKSPSQHYFERTKTLVSYAPLVTCYVDKGKMSKMSGVKTKQLLIWISVVEMSVDVPSCSGGKIHFKTSLGVGKSFPVSAFLSEDEIEGRDVASEIVPSL